MPNKIINTRINKETKTILHPKYVVTMPPKVGAMIGDTATTNIKVENIFAISLGANKSLTMALDDTIPTHPPKACNNLSPINI